MKYTIIEERKGKADVILFETRDLFSAESYLCRALNNGHDAYLMKVEDENIKKQIKKFSDGRRGPKIHFEKPTVINQIDRAIIDVDGIRIKCTKCGHYKLAFKNFSRASKNLLNHGFKEQCKDCLNDLGLRIRQDKLKARLEAGYPVKKCDCGRLHEYRDRKCCDLCNMLKRGTFGRINL